MSFISKFLSSPKKIFFFSLLCVYIAMVTYALPPYGVVPAMVIALMTPLSIFLVAYPTYYILLPRLMNEFLDEHDNLVQSTVKYSNKKKVLRYCYLPLSILLIIAAMAFVWVCLALFYNVFDLPLDNVPEEYSRSRFLNPPLFTLTYIFTNIFYLYNRHRDNMNEKKDLEMKMLKSQINSHFLFNALNNIYSMAYFNKKETPQYVVKLSQMLRYVLEDCEADQVPISGEIKYIENYIDFQKSRFGTVKDVTFNYVQNHNGEIQIPPMIFQPLIENCFKHCPLQNDNSYVHIEIETSQNQVKFVSENTQPLMKQPPDKNRNGIGIKNMENRLSIFFKENYSMNILEEDGFYRTELIINI